MKELHVLVENKQSVCLYVPVCLQPCNYSPITVSGHATTKYPMHYFKQAQSSNVTVRFRYLAQVDKQLVAGSIPRKPFDLPKCINVNKLLQSCDQKLHDLGCLFMA